MVDLTGSRAAKSPARSIGSVDGPAVEAVAGTRLRLTGWALDMSGIDRVEVRCNGACFSARYGVARSDVAATHPGYPDSRNPGFEFDSDLASSVATFAAPRQRVEIVALAGDGNETLLAVRSLVDSTPGELWRELPRSPGATFYLLPGLSGATKASAGSLGCRYRLYESETIRIGMRVPILYLRTTQGAQGDYAFDPDFDTSRSTRGRLIADDSLARLLEAAEACRLPVLVTLNGGIWADASGSAPDWDLNDRLELDPANCQWNERDEVMPDDMLKHLPGSQRAPELARALTLNVYAAEVRRRKKRNLQQAAAVIAAWMQRHPDLFVGVNLDPDVYVNPFFSEAQWYDYNPGTLRQFRHWLAATGPYAGASLPGVADLSAYRRERPLTLAEASRFANREFTAWDEVDPPRRFSRDAGSEYWHDPWVHQWEQFRRHLVTLHYDELARWLIDAGIPGDRIWSSQGLIGTYEGSMPVALDQSSPVKNYDSGGVTIAGSRPRGAHLGAILYGSAADNRTSTETGEPLHSILSRVDPHFAVVEFNTADLANPRSQPDYASAYRGLRDLWNAGARFVSPMAWNGSSGIDSGKPDYAPHTAWRDTPLEEAAFDFLLARANLPPGTLLWTFGSQRHGDDDGWTTEAGHAVAGPGRLALLPDRTGRVCLVSPPGLRVDFANRVTVVLGLSEDAPLARLALEAEFDGVGRIHLRAEDEDSAAPRRRIAAGLVIEIRPHPGIDAIRCRYATRIRAALTFGTVAPVTLARIAIAAAGP